MPGSAPESVARLGRAQRGSRILGFSICASRPRKNFKSSRLALTYSHSNRNAKITIITIITYNDDVQVSVIEPEAAINSPSRSIYDIWTSVIGIGDFVMSHDIYTGTGTLNNRKLINSRHVKPLRRTQLVAVAYCQPSTT